MVEFEFYKTVYKDYQPTTTGVCLIYLSLPYTLQRITRSSFWGLSHELPTIEVPVGMGEKFKEKIYDFYGDYDITSYIKEKEVKKEEWNDAKNKNLLRFIHAQDSGGISMMVQVLMQKPCRK